MTNPESFPLTPGLPIPAKPKNGLFPKVAKYPWATMKVGDSFFVPLAKGRNFTAATQQMKSHPDNGRYETRRVVEDGNQGVRVWRTK